jgi:N-acetyl-gamma-glutamyl-phosphate reductase
VIRAGVVGATGYTGAELLRLLAGHPKVDIKVITSRAEAERRVDDIFPNLRGHVDASFSEPHLEALAECDIVFFATPNGIAMTMVPELLDMDVKVVDLSADFRLKNANVWAEWYGMSHSCPELLLEAVYGLPELNRAAIREARLVANPGCYPTAIILGFLPLLEQNRIDLQCLIADAKSGVSGAGRQAQVGTLLCETAENFKAYGVPRHRHSPEIQQVCSDIAKRQVGITFVPHLVPMIRGIHATLYCHCSNPDDDLQMVFAGRYADEPFVDVLPPGAHPETRSVRGVNECKIAVHQTQGGMMVIVLSVIDNLIKGAAGQAVQNMNLMFGYDETLGTKATALLP